MSIHRISLEAVQKIRQYIKTALTPPESENHPEVQISLDAVDELPEPESLDALGDLFKFASLSEEETYAPNTEGRWFVSAANPGAALIKLPGLSLKPDIRLVGYLHRTSNYGKGVVWAVPEAASTTAQLERALEDNPTDEQTPPHPQGALANFMQAIEGDRTPSSYLMASILRRELLEFGALGQSCNWSHHRLIASLPTQVNWQWRTEMPKDFTPKVGAMPNGKVVVEFFTCRVVPPIAIFRHLDQYPVGEYLCQYADQAIAIKASPSQKSA